MPVRPVELLRFARKLDRSDEASCRAAINRAYYCAYHEVMPVVDKLPPTAGYNLPGHVRHQQVADRLEEWRIPERCRKASKDAGSAAIIARDYRTAMSGRKTADYWLQGSVLPGEADLILDRVANIHAFMSRLKLALPEDFPPAKNSGAGS